MFHKTCTRRSYLLQHPNAFFGIQELNSLDTPSLNKALENTSFSFIGTSTVGTSFNHGVIYNHSLYSLNNQSSTDISDLNSLQASHRSLKTPSGGQTNRYLHLTLSRNNTIYHVINVHLRWYCDPQATVSALQTVLQTLPNCIIMGDFNTDLSLAQIPLSNAKLYVSKNGYIKGSAPNYAYETDDAIAHNLDFPAAASSSSTVPQPSFASSMNYSAYGTYPTTSGSYAQQSSTTAIYDQPNKHFLISNHISGSLQAMVQYLLAVNSPSFNLNDFQSMVNMTPSRSHPEFQAQIAHWEPLLIRAVSTSTPIDSSFHSAPQSSAQSTISPLPQVSAYSTSQAPVTQTHQEDPEFKITKEKATYLFGHKSLIEDMVFLDLLGAQPQKYEYWTSYVNNLTNHLIREHISGQLQHAVQYLLSLNNPNFRLEHEFDQMIALTPNRSDEEFQKQLSSWGLYIDQVCQMKGIGLNAFSKSPISFN